MPDGDNMLAMWEGMQDHVGFHVQRDLLSWVEGSAGMISLPGRGGKEECVLFMRVKDSERAKQVLNGLLERARQYLNTRGQRTRFVPLRRFPAEGEFREVRIASLPWFRPVFGNHKEIFAMGCSARVFRSVNAAVRGESPTIAENPRFQALEVPQQGQVCEIYYQNVEGALRGVADVVGTIGFVLSVLPRNNDSEPAIKLGQILTKGAAFLRDIDLGIDYGGWTRYDARNHALYSRQMVRVKTPRAKAQPRRRPKGRRPAQPRRRPKGKKPAGTERAKREGF
jgi:hypothetical protein